jgi:protein-disulfide isomerase
MSATRRAVVTALGAAGFLGACGQSGAKGGPSGPRSRFEVSDDMALGDPNAPAVLVEYASVMCSHCRTFHEKMLPTIKTKYVDTGKLRYVFREFATEPREYAYAGFLLARCAGTTPKSYFELIETLFQQQISIFQAAQAGQGREKMLEIARSAGLSEERFNTCITDQKAIERLNEVERKGMADFQINSTPTLILNGVKLDVSQTGTLEALSAAIDAKLAAK